MYTASRSLEYIYMLSIPVGCYPIAVYNNYVYVNINICRFLTVLLLRTFFSLVSYFRAEV